MGGRQLHRLTESQVKNAKPLEIIVPVGDAAVDVVTKYEKDKVRSALLRGKGDRRSAVMRNIRKLAAAADELETTRDVTIRKRTRWMCDGGGLWLQVSAGDDGSVRKSWVFRYSLPQKVISKGGKARQRQRQMGLGSLSTMSLTDARSAALELRKQRLSGIDPIEQRRGQKAAAAVAEAKQMTFDECRDAFIADHGFKWRNARHARNWVQSLQDHVSPVFGSLPVAAIDQELVIKMLRPLWREKQPTASRVRGRVEAILDWAAVHRHRPADNPNPARWKGALQFVFAKTNDVKPMDALPYREMPPFMAQLRATPGRAAMALQFIILTACRSGELLAAEWNEIDLNSRVWTIPPQHTKRKREHRIPLSDTAADLLTSFESEGHPKAGTTERIFPINSNAMLRLCKQIRPDRLDITVHGFRSSFRDWTAECTDTANEISEMSLGHAISSAVERAYRRGDLLEKRQLLMQRWSDYLAGTEGKVIQLSRA